MAKAKGVRLDKNHRDALDRMVDDGAADNAGEALRQTSQVELARQGYLSDDGGSVLTASLNTVGLVCALIGAVWLATTVVYPVSLRLPAVAFMLASIGAFSLEWLLNSHALGDALRRVVSRGEKA